MTNAPHPRVAVVTGAARGIGKAIARRLADDGFAIGLLDQDVVVNNAGFARVAPIDQMSATGFDQVLAVHLRGAFLATRAVAPHMIAAGWGRIVNISSVSALGDPQT
jgi:3-oxoacyl-[acyl-carrier protein] reductase